MKHLSIILLFTLLSCGSTEQQVSNQDQKAPAEKSFWTQQTVTDEFGDPVEGESSLRANIEGSKNGKNTNIELVKNEDILAFFLHDPETGAIALMPNNSFLNIRVKHGDSAPYFVETFIRGNAIYDTKSVIDSIMNSSSDLVKFSVDISRTNSGYTGKYLFEINPKDYLSDL